MPPWQNRFKGELLLKYRVHGDAVSKEEVAQVGRVSVFRLEGGESL